MWEKDNTYSSATKIKGTQQWITSNIPPANCFAGLHLILKNTVVYDGTGAPPFHGNIGIAQGKIAVLSQQPIAEKAKEIVDLGGLAAAPGFIL